MGVKAAIINYGVGNLYSISAGLRRAGAEPAITVDPKVVAEADIIVFPGVGAYPAAMRVLSTMKDEIREHMKAGKVVLGICLGMQLLLEGGEEGGTWTPGLAAIPGKAVRLPSTGLKVPHMGWNNVYKARDDPLWNGIEDGSFFYFAHSYYAAGVPEENIVGFTEYGVRFPSIIRKGNVIGTQFHPEKSGKKGLQLLRNVVEIAKCP